MHVLNIITVVLSSLFCSTFGNYAELKLRDDLIHMDLDNITNNIFIGGKNVLLKLSPDLAELKNISTGPQLDYVTCIENGDCEGKIVDNRNKVLLVDSVKRFLLTCGSLRHGVCQLRSLDSLLETSRSTDEEYVVSNAHFPAVALITPWKEPNLGKHALYIGTTWDLKYKDLQLLVRPSVSTRNIEGSKLFKFSEKGAVASSYLQFNAFNYIVKYIYGFSSGKFNYFVTVQETTESYTNNYNPKVLKTFIIRLCQQDIRYVTYIELPLECQSSNGMNFNMAQSGYVTKPGGHLSKSLGLQPSDDVLVIAYFESTAGWDGSSQNSAICVYSVKEINKLLADDQQNCIDGKYAGKKLGLPWVPYGNTPCAENKVTMLFQKYRMQLTYTLFIMLYHTCRVFFVHKKVVLMVKT